MTGRHLETEQAAVRAYGLDDYWLAIYRQRWIILLVVVASTALAWWLSRRIEPRYEASASFYVPVDISRLGGATAMDEGRARLPGANMGETKGYVALLEGGDANRKIAGELGKTSEQLYRNVDFVATRQGIIKVYARDKDPVLAAKLANRYVTYFNEFHTTSMEDDLARTLARLATERRLVSDRQRERGNAREAFEKEHQIASLDAELVQLEGKRDRYEDQLKLVEADVSAARQRLAVRERQLREEQQSYEAGAVAIQSPLVDSLRETMVEAQAALAQKSVELQPTHPEVQALQARLATSRAAFEEEVRRVLQSKSKLVGTRYEKLREDLATAHADVAAAEARAQALRTGDGGVRERIAKIPTLQRQWDDFQRQAARDSAELEILDKEYQDTHLKSLRQRDAVVVVQQAMPPERPVYPIPVLNAIIAAAAGLVVGVIYALLLDHIDDTARQRRIRRLAVHAWLAELTPGSGIGVGGMLGLDRKLSGNGRSGNGRSGNGVSATRNGSASKAAATNGGASGGGAAAHDIEVGLSGGVGDRPPGNGKSNGAAATGGGGNGHGPAGGAA